MLLVIGLTIQLYAYCFLELLFNVVKKEKVYAITLFFGNNLHSFLYLGSLIFCLDLNYCLESFAFHLKNFLSVSCRAGLLTTDSLSFLFIWEYLYFAFTVDP